MQKLTRLASSQTERPASFFTAGGEVEARMLTTPLDIGQTLAASHDLKAAMSRVLETLGRHHDMLRGVVMLREREPERDYERIARFLSVIASMIAQAIKRIIGYKVKKYDIDAERFRR